MKKIFESVAMDAPSKSAFDLSHERKMSVQFGKLYPCLLEEVLPADEYSVRTETLVRMAPMVAPVMERIDAYIHYFFVPNRIIWDNWEEFITGGDDGNSTVDMTTLQLNNAAQLGKGTLADYFGLPTWNDPLVDPSVPIITNRLPWYCYHEIWNEYYRDQNLQEKYDYKNMAYEEEFFTVRTRAWQKDYFTSALPYPQKGPAVPLPVNSSFTPQYSDVTKVLKSDGTLSIPDTPLSSGSDPGNQSNLVYGSVIPETNLKIENLEPTQTIDTTSVTIEELRRSARLQEWLEKAARGGSRLVELIRNYFGVFSGDARLDRPEYLGGGKTPITISEVLNTTGIQTGTNPDAEGAVQGEMSGHGIAVGANNSFKYKVKEHGYIMGIMSIVPQATYKQGIPRLFKRGVPAGVDQTTGGKLDWYWPQFANIGEQEVRNEELYHDWNSDILDNSTTFGYQQRYAEYKYRPNSIHGDFRDNLAFWTVARDFANRPNLNGEFIECDDESLQDIFAVTDTSIDKFYVQMYHSMKARRPMPYFSRPEL